MANPRTQRRYDWTNPDDDMIAAVTHARTMKVRGVTEIQAAEVMLNVSATLWYQQLTSWLETAPGFIHGRDADLFQRELTLIKTMIDQGYNPGTRSWWGLDKLLAAKRASAEIAIMDLGNILRRASDQSLHVVAPSWFIIIALICGGNWERRYASFLRAAEKMSKAKQGGH